MSAKRDVPVGDPAVDDLQRGDGVVDGGPDLAASRAVVEVAPSTNAISASTFGCSSRPIGDRVALADVHVVEEHAEVGLVDAELLCTAGEVSPILRPTTRGAGGQLGLA